MQTKVVVQHRKRLCREGLAAFLETAPDVSVVGMAPDAHALADLCSQTFVDVAVIEGNAAGWDPCRLAAALRRGAPSLRFVALPASGTQYSDPLATVCSDVSLVPGGGMAAVLDAVRSATHQPPTPLPEMLAARPAAPVLTRREIEILELVAQGWRSQEVAERLGVSRKTVENHKQRIFTKLGVQSQAHAVVVAMRHDLISTRAS